MKDISIEDLRNIYNSVYADRARTCNPLKISVLWNKMFKRG